ncbi:MAG: hypothetical protein K6G65_04360 [Lachnospiraceae bacterium]|nr:hypothetical protein [Lachnospiraceae bacterium]
MRSTKERILLLHQRASEIQREQDIRHLVWSGGTCAVLLIVLPMLLHRFSRIVSGYRESYYSASSLLGEEVGGYVLVAVLMFMAGVIVTVMIQRFRRLGEESENGGEE